MARLPIKTVDVFTTVPFKGNPVAVVLDGTSLSTAQMQQIARWTNLSETTFVLPPTEQGADYRVRIFTPGAELPFAGHPTIGTAHALLEAGMVRADNGILVQQCGAGLVTLTVEGAGSAQPWIAFELPTASLTALDAAEAAQLESILRADLEVNVVPYLVDVGPRWVIAQLTSARAIRAARQASKCAPSHRPMASTRIRCAAAALAPWRPTCATRGSWGPSEARCWPPRVKCSGAPGCSGSRCRTRRSGSVVMR